MLFDETMLPRIKTRIPQMEDLLQAEQAYLDVILDMAYWLGDRTMLIGEEVMNIPNLKAKIKQITGWDCDILEDAEHLTITIRYYFDAWEPLIEQEQRILMYVPAHLKVVHEFLQKYAGTARIRMRVGAGSVTRYTCYPQEVNGARSGTAAIRIRHAGCACIKLIAYPEGRNDR